MLPPHSLRAAAEGAGVALVGLEALLAVPGARQVNITCCVAILSCVYVRLCCTAETQSRP
jgi:hypothetical protein